MEQQKLMPVLRFPEFNSAWGRIRLGKLFEFKNGINASKEQYGKGIKFINVLDILNNDFITYEKIVGSVDIDEATLRKNAVEYGDILFQRSSETRDEVGTACVYLDKENTATFGGFVIRGKKIGDYEPVFINTLLKTDLARKEITIKSGGSTRYNVGQNTLASVIIPIPNYPEQQKIASFFTTINQKISQLKQKKTLLEQYKNGVMQEIFSQEIRFKDDDGKEFPKWEKIKLGEFLNQEVREVKKPSTTYLAIGVRSHCKGTFQKESFDPDKIAMDKLYQVKKGDLIVNITFAWESAIAIVKNEDEGGLVSHRFPTYVFNGEFVYGSFFQHVIIQKKFRQLLDLISPGGAGRNRVLNKKDFLKLEWVIPCLPEQTKIADFLSAIEDKINHTHSQIEKAEAWKKGLLQQMFV